MVGVKTVYAVLADVLFTTNVVPATVGLTSPLAAGQRQKFRAYIPINTGATGGVRFQVVVPAAVAKFVASYKIVNVVTPAITPGAQVASAVVANALAVAGNNWLEIEGYVKNGVNAGSIDIRLAQNTSDAATLTVLEGGTMDITVY